MMYKTKKYDDYYIIKDIQDYLSDREHNGI